MSNVGLEYSVDELQRQRARDILDAKGFTTGAEWFMQIFQEEPEVVAKRLYKSGINYYDITALCFELKGDDDPWTQQLCDELETLHCEEECK